MKRNIEVIKEGIEVYKENSQYFGLNKQAQKCLQVLQHKAAVNDLTEKMQQFRYLEDSVITFENIVTVDCLQDYYRLNDDLSSYEFLYMDMIKGDIPPNLLAYQQQLEDLRNRVETAKIKREFFLDSSRKF